MTHTNWSHAKVPLRCMRVGREGDGGRWREMAYLVAREEADGARDEEEEGGEDEHVREVDEGGHEADDLELGDTWEIHGESDACT